MKCTSRPKMTDLEAMLYSFYADDCTMNLEVFMKDAADRLERSTEDGEFNEDETNARWEARLIINDAAADIDHLNSFRDDMIELEATKRRY
jgi:hypothetical protein